MRELQAEVDSKGLELMKCQEECSALLHQLVSGQQKLKELTIENLDMKETLKASGEVQKELASEVGTNSIVCLIYDSGSKLDTYRDL